MLRNILIKFECLLGWLLGDGFSHTGVLFHASILTITLKHSIIDELVVGHIAGEEALKRGGGIFGSWLLIFLALVCLYNLIEYLISTLEKAEVK